MSNNQAFVGSGDAEAHNTAQHPAEEGRGDAVAHHCLVLACGNTLRGDDGVGWELARRAADFDPQAEVITSGQWTPELAEPLSRAVAVLFLDCSTDSEPGEVRLRTIEPSTVLPRLFTHHLCPADLLALSRDLYQKAPHCALLLTVGAASLELAEELTATVTAALPEAQLRLEEAINRCNAERCNAER